MCLLLCSATSLDNTSLRGRLLDAVTKDPIEGAKITLYAAGDEKIIYTDEEGKFKFVNISGAKCNLIISKTGYIEERIRDVEINPNEPNFLIVNVKQVNNIFSVRSAN